jgi:hypothetical protein
MYSTIRRAVPNTIVASSARTSSSNSGNLKDTTESLPVSDNIVVTTQLTANTKTGAALTTGLSVFLDQSPDGGTTWVGEGFLANFTSSTGTKRVILHQGGLASGLEEFDPDPLALRGVSTVTHDLILNVALTQDVRIRWEVETNQTATFAVYAVAQP